MEKKLWVQTKATTEGVPQEMVFLEILQNS